MKLYELITFTLRVGTVAQAMDCLEGRLADSVEGVSLLGCWASDIGPLNQIALLRGFVDEATRQAERERYLGSVDAFGIGTWLTDMRVENYSRFGFLKPLPPGAHGPFYEFRVYDLVPAGLAPTLKGWEQAIGPRTAAEYSAVYAAFYATDGRTPRYLHIWPYSSLEQRLEVRSRAVRDGVWPAQNTAPQLRDMHSTLYLPARFSPLQ
ncbi:NIPSNAP family protein [Pseudomonas sp. Fl5BN2]|uniref:NIPSNAP family protein n=1 Tax=unclassified Pseudomonas TaxID=196821 RepID=UPI0013790755|nr:MULTISPECIES: NIPSNAP family protein [unclassified Pseudomonas]NBF04639.1 NIPSNAP family protein [Pseudomonas sp. Fl5BN2]NBF12539.1 NIPSNAP family protein [Pseudomonas sp. Fl4BN1]